MTDTRVDAINAWGVGTELIDVRLQVDGKSANELYIGIAKNIHGDKYDYSQTFFRAMKQAVRVGYEGKFYDVVAALHLLDSRHGGIHGL